MAAAARVRRPQPSAAGAEDVWTMHSPRVRRSLHLFDAMAAVSLAAPAKARGGGASQRHRRRLPRPRPTPRREPRAAAVASGGRSAASRPATPDRTTAFGTNAPRTSMTALVKVFRCGPWREVGDGRDLGPRWKTSQGGSRVGPGAVYGERALTVGTSVVGDRRMVRDAGRAGCHVPPMSGIFVGPWGRSGPRSGGWPWPGEQPVDRCLMENRERIGQGDGRSVMLPAPVAAPATVVADRDGTSR